MAKKGEYSLTPIGKKVIDLLSDEKPRALHEIQKVIKVDSKYLQRILKTLWKHGFIFRSEKTIKIVKKEKLPNGKVKWIKGRICLYAIAKSKTYSTYYGTDMYKDHQQTRVRIIVHFISFSPAFEKKYPEADRTSPKKVIETLRELKAATAREVAEKSKVDVAYVTKILHEKWKKGEIERKGRIKEIYDGSTGELIPKEVAFRGKLQGFVYGITQEDVQGKIDEADLFSHASRDIFREVKKYSMDHKLLPMSKFRYSPFNWDSEKITTGWKSLVQANSHVKYVEIQGEILLYDERLLANEHVESELRRWQDLIAHKHSSNTNVGRFWEMYSEFAIDEVEKAKGFSYGNLVWWSQVRRGKEVRNITLSNKREIDRVLQLQLIPFGIKHYFVFEAKYRRSGITKKDWDTFIEKLCGSNEFGYTKEIEIDGHTRHIRALKHNVMPVVVTPFIQPDSVEYILRSGGQIIYLSRMQRWLKEKFGKKLNIQKLIKEVRNNKIANLDKFFEEQVINYYKLPLPEQKGEGGGTTVVHKNLPTDTEHVHKNSV